MKLFSNNGKHIAKPNRNIKKVIPTISHFSKEKTQQPTTRKAQRPETDYIKLFETAEQPVFTSDEQTADIVAVEEVSAEAVEDTAAEAVEDAAAEAVEDAAAEAVEDTAAEAVEDTAAEAVEDAAAEAVEDAAAEVVADAAILEGATRVIDSVSFTRTTESHIDMPAKKELQPVSVAPKKKDGIAKIIASATALIALLAVLVGLCVFFVDTLRETLSLQDSIRNDTDIAIEDVTSNPDSDASIVPEVTPTPEPTPVATPEPTPEAPREVLEKYAKDAKKNKDMFGWIKIEGTKVDYPVMHTPDDPEKYLYKSFHGLPTASGSLFIDAKCSPDSDNLIIYGHNIKNGTMFNSLLKYENVDYYGEHPTIQFDTLYEEQEFEVMSVFYDRVYYKSETDVFKFYQFIDAEDREHFDSAVETLKEKSIYNTGVSAEYGDQLIMLVTCAYHTENGRFVVVARRAQQ